jgi:hypothetical protein
MRRETSASVRASGPAGASLALGVLLAGSTVGCAAVPDYGEYLMRWQGKNLANLRADWGAPDYRYRDHRGRETVQYVYRETIFESLSSGREVVWWCLTNFHLNRDGRVADTSSSGNHCVPPEDLAAERERRNRRRGEVPYVPPADATE